MAFYVYRCNKCKKEFEEMLTMDNRDVPLSQPCPNKRCKTVGKIERLVGAPPIIDPTRISGLLKPPNAFQNKLREIKKQYGGMNQTTHGHNTTEL